MYLYAATIFIDFLSTEGKFSVKKVENESFYLHYIIMIIIINDAMFAINKSLYGLGRCQY